MWLGNWVRWLAYQGRILLRSHRPRAKADALARLYLVVNGFLSELGVDYWLAWGTLLGFHREGAILAHDRDVDFGVLEDDYQRILGASARLPEGFTLHDTSCWHGGPKLYVDYRGWKADIYFYRRCEGVLRIFLTSRYPADTAPVPIDQVLPTRPATFLGRPTRVPARVVDHLVHCYGYIGPDAEQDHITGYYHPAGPPRP
jgi:hypothetical protein